MHSIREPVKRKDLPVSKFHSFVRTAWHVAMQSTKIRESLCSASDRNMCSNPQDSTRAFDQHLSREPTGSRRRVSCSEIRNRDERTESRLQQEVPKRPKPIHHCLLTATVRLAANGKNFHSRHERDNSQRLARSR